MEKHQKLYILLGIFMIFSFVLILAEEVPSQPQTFRGKIQLINGGLPHDLPTGTNITAYISEIASGSSVIPYSLNFDYFISAGNGTEAGKNVVFKVGNMIANQNSTYSAGTTTLLNLTITDFDNDGYSVGYSGYNGPLKDCNDNDASIYPGAPEIFDGIDNNCIDGIDEGISGLVGDVSGNVGGLSLEIDDSSRIGNVTFKDGDGNIILEFDYDFNSGTLDLSAVTITVDPNAGEGGIIIQGIDLTSQGLTKTVYINKTSSSNTICIIDDEVASIIVIDDCANGVKLTCDGTTGAYTCTTVGERYKIEGLSHSGVTQYSYTAPVTTTSSGGGGGGGGCSTTWTCTEWNVCSVAGTQTRICSYPTNLCAPKTTKPAEVQSCTYTAPIVLSTPEETNAPEEQPATPTGGTGITGAVIGNLTSPTGIGVIVVLIVLAIGAIILLRNRFKKKAEKSEDNEKSEEETEEKVEPEEDPLEKPKRKKQK